MSALTWNKVRQVIFTITDAASGEAPVRFYPDPDTGTMQTQRLGE